MPVIIDEISAEVDRRDQPEREQPEVQVKPPAVMRADLFRRQLRLLEERRARLRAE